MTDVGRKRHCEDVALLLHRGLCIPMHAYCLKWLEWNLVRLDVVRAEEKYVGI